MSKRRFPRTRHIQAGHDEWVHVNRPKLAGQGHVPEIASLIGLLLAALLVMTYWDEIVFCALLAGGGWLAWKFFASSR